MDTASEPIRFDTKIAIMLHEDLANWQSLNVTAFLMSGIAASNPEVIGEPYEDADGTTYLPLLGQPVVVFSGDSETLSSAHTKGLGRDLRMAIYTRDMFTTGNDKTFKGATLHP